MCSILKNIFLDEEWFYNVLDFLWLLLGWGVVVLTTVGMLLIFIKFIHKRSFDNWLTDYRGKFIQGLALILLADVCLSLADIIHTKKFEHVQVINTIIIAIAVSLLIATNKLIDLLLSSYTPKLGTSHAKMLVINIVTGVLLVCGLCLLRILIEQ